MLQFFICIVFELSCPSVEISNSLLLCIKITSLQETNGKCIKVVNVSGIQSRVMLTGTVRCSLTPNFVSDIVFMSVFCQLYTLLDKFYTISFIYSIFLLCEIHIILTLTSISRDYICLQLFMIYICL